MAPGADRQSAHLNWGDIIVAANGKPINDWLSYLEFIELETDASDTVSLTLLRSGQQIMIEVPAGTQS